MTRISQLVAASAVFLFSAGAAHAQATGAGPAIGSADASKVSRATNEVREDYNRAAGREDRRKKGKKVEAVPAKPEEVVAGRTVSTLKGELLGTVEAVDPDGAVVVTGTGKVKIPLEGFGRTAEGLVLAISKAEFDAAVAAAHVAHPAG